ncbi:MAG: T9SS type A sorting domain-containing protein [Candidatus Kryptonium sp.]|nr:T9SS type A sorting domain-containing protein [Candidatus Kryptonium sp.]
MRKAISILGMIFFVVNFSLAQITIDGNPSEWTGTLPITANSWKYSAGTAGGLNEWIWRDATGDERTDFANPDKRVDIVEVRISSNATYLYFLVKMNDIDITSGNGAPMVQISIDRNRTPGSGEEWLGGYADTKVDNAARWEYLILTRFGSGNSDLRVWTHTWSGSFAGDAAISATYDVIEGRVPWSSLGGAPNDNTFRFTISTYRANPSDDTWDISGVSNTLDCVTTTGPNTWNEVSDGVINFYVDIEFLNDQPLSVQTVSLSAIAGDSKVTLVWETRNEVDNAGFEILRKAENESNYTLIASYLTNDELKGLGTNAYGKRYTYVDRNVKNGLGYEYKIVAVSFSGQRQEIGIIYAKPGSEIPSKFVLYQNYPNPFNPGTEIKFDLPESGHVKLEVFNLAGERVAVLYDGYMEAGYGKTIRWNANGFSSGVYLYKLSAGKYVDVKKMVLMK